MSIKNYFTREQKLTYDRMIAEIRSCEKLWNSYMAAPTASLEGALRFKEFEERRASLYFAARNFAYFMGEKDL